MLNECGQLRASRAAQALDARLTNHVVASSLNLALDARIGLHEQRVRLAQTPITRSPTRLKGTDPKFWSKIAKKFFVETASLGMGEMRPKILGGCEYYVIMGAKYNVKMGGQGGGGW